ncbi:MotA/TolQ/ExbB proton channel family protein [Ochrobactrum sp. CGA5]|uniref:MotA/TolQ/ExbB proton channel family protein n=1 Tax=Ochrobactrum sp. CGA5 TaxID=2583453 RepID=UPI0011238864|nr:MotA/TolQ/ExbB proton channel family protein [Ochrobactrum sp. CGA5]
MRKFRYYTFLSTAIAMATLLIGTYFHEEIADIVSHNVYINSLILGIFCASTIYLLIDALFTIRKEHLWRRYGANKRCARAIFGRRFEAIPEQTGTILDEMIQKWKESIGWKATAIDYISGSLVGVGLLGTFIGLMHTMGSVFDVLSSQASGKDLVAGLSVPLSGMATAFSASLMGLTSSLTLGLQSMLLDKSNHEFFAGIDDWAISEKEEVQDVAIGSKSRGGGIKYLSNLAKSTADLNENVLGLLKVNSALASHSMKGWQEAIREIKELRNSSDEHFKMSSRHSSDSMNGWQEAIREIRELRNSFDELFKVSSRLCELGDESNQHAIALNNTMAANTARVERMRVGLDSVMEGSVSRTGELGDHVRQLNQNIAVLVDKSSADQNSLERVAEFQRLMHDASFACLQEIVAARTTLESAFNRRTMEQAVK